MDRISFEQGLKHKIFSEFGGKQRAELHVLYNLNRVFRRCLKDLKAKKYRGFTAKGLEFNALIFSNMAKTAEKGEEKEAEKAENLAARLIALIGFYEEKNFEEIDKGIVLECISFIEELIEKRRKLNGVE